MVPPDPVGSKSPPVPVDSTFPLRDRDGTLSVSDADDVSIAKDGVEMEPRSHQAFCLIFLFSLRFHSVGPLAPTFPH